ncbi:non-ribosomal peptide synthetase [Candidatus Pantoea bituminis]|uniref:non-ribosomal peptide synthetase n=1 Tax=Candidatus Pantoea bituminis TaxID=2831036 RepID=UPI001C05F588|nr:non-ribosomal peptide synthetase [Pantoea bituminis]
MIKGINVIADNNVLSLEQKKMWYQFIHYPDSTAYNISEEFLCTGKIQVQALISALKKTIIDTPSLAVIFKEESDGVSQHTATHLVHSGDYITLNENFSCYEDALSFVSVHVRRSFDLYNEIPVRMVITRYQAEQWIVALSFHHIAIDGWSARMFYEDLNRNYKNLVSNEEQYEIKHQVDYPHYVTWQQNPAQQELRQLSHAYWCEYLAGATPILELPLDKKRAGNFNSSGTSLILPLPDNIIKSIKKSAKKLLVTEWSFYITTFSVLLQKYSNQTDFCIGYPSVNRSMPGSESIGGLFTNTLVLKADTDPSENFSACLIRNYDRLLNSFGHDDVQLETVINDINVTRSASCNPLYQVMFSQQDRCNYGLNLYNTRMEQCILPVSDVKLDLSVMIDTDNEGTRGILEYADQLFSRKEIEVLWHHYLELLNSFAANVDQPLHLPILSDMGSQPPVKALSYTKPTYHSLNCWFESTVEKYPQRIAVEYESTSLTYSQLNDKANSLSRELLRQGAKPGELIGLSLNRSEYLLVGIIAILKTGCGYLPLDPTHPMSRIDYILQDTECRIVVTDAMAASALSGKNLRLVDVSFYSDEKKIKTLGEVINDGSSLAYCIYTSGSTGNPKGVLISHSNVMRLFENVKPWFDFSENDVWTLFHSYSFDFSVWEIFGALLYGGKLVVVPYNISRSPDDFRKLLKQTNVTVLNQTPSAFNQLSLIETMNCDESDHLEHLRYVIFGGEALNFASLSGWVSKYGDDRPSLINMYGITETTVHVTYRKISLADIINNTGSLIGDAIPDLEIAILDSKGYPVPTGMVGEMHIAGAGLAIGYLNRDSLNREKFIPITVRGKQIKFYKTGDLAKRRFDGELEYFGRADNQVKIRGHRIELGEIESALITLPDVLEAVVLARPDSHGLDRLKAWVSINTKTQLNSLLIKAQLGRALPSYMVPQDIIIIDSLPLTTNGKINTHALPDNTNDELPLTQSENARTTLEALLVDIWCNIIGRSYVGIHENFYALGGDSLLAVMFIQQCRKHHLSLSVLDLLNHQTISELANYISHEQSIEEMHQPHAGNTVHDDARMSDQPEHIYPMSGMQQVMFEHYRRGTMQRLGVYHVQQSYSIKDKNPRPQAMLKAIKMLVSAHPVLRTVALFDENMGWRQRFATEMPVDFKFHDLTQTRSQEIKGKIAEIKQQDLNNPFTYNLADKALFRCHWLQISTFQFELLLSTHHGIADGWGNQVLLKQLFDLYSTLRENGVAQIKPSPNVFLEYLALEKRIR